MQYFISFLLVFSTHRLLLNYISASDLGLRCVKFGYVVRIIEFFYRVGPKFLDYVGKRVRSQGPTKNINK